MFWKTCLKWLAVLACCFLPYSLQAEETQVMNGVDDGTVHIQLGHVFPYYGGIFTDAWMSSNGFILLYDPTTGYGNSSTNNQGCCSGLTLLVITMLETVLVTCLLLCGQT